MCNIVLLGAGSTSFTLSLVRDIILAKGLEGSAFRLVDINKERLDNVRAVVETYKKEVNSDIKIESYIDRREAFVGANYIICAVKYGGYIPLEAERKIAEAHGYYRGIGDRVSCYYGGVGAFWQIRFFEDVARDMKELCPDALLLQTANPVLEGTNYLTKYTDINAVGVCHGHLGYIEVAKIMGLEPYRCSAEVFGYNHCVYMTEFKYDGRDAYPLLDKWIEEKSEEYWKSEEYLRPGMWGFSPDALSPGAVDAYRHYGLMPIGDTVRSVSPWWHHTDIETKKRWYGTGGGFDSEECWDKYLKSKEEQREEIQQALEKAESVLKVYPLEKSAEQHIDVIRAIETDSNERFTLNVPNNGCISGLPDDTLVEIPVTANKSSITGIKMKPLPSKIMNNIILPRFCRANNIIEAYRNGDRDLLVVELMNDPRTKGYEQAKTLIDDLLAQDWNKEANEHYK